MLGVILILGVILGVTEGDGDEEAKRDVDTVIEGVTLGVLVRLGVTLGDLEGDGEDGEYIGIAGIRNVLY